MNTDNLINNYTDWLEQASLTESKKNLLKTAIALYADQGISRVTTKEIAKAAGYSETMIFKHFGSKAGLTQAIIEPITTEILPHYSAAFFEEVDVAQDLQDIIATIVRARFRFLSENAAVMQIIIGETLINNDFRATYGSRIMQNQDTFSQTIWQKMQATGEMRDDVDLTSFLRLIVSQVLFLFLQKYKFGLEIDENAELDKISLLMLYAIQK